MRTHDARRGVGRAACAAALVIAAGAAGCASTVPSPSWLPERDQVARTPYGALAVLRVRGEDRSLRTVTGELIAVETDSTFLLAEDPATGFIGIDNERITEFAVRDHAGPGGVQTFSEGALTLGVGSYALERVQAHARFPQGLPAGLDRTSLRSPWAQNSQ